MSLKNKEQRRSQAFKEAVERARLETAEVIAAWLESDATDGYDLAAAAAAIRAGKWRGKEQG